jgi:hypothetical protein
VLAEVPRDVPGHLRRGERTWLWSGALLDRGLAVAAFDDGLVTVEIATASPSPWVAAVHSSGVGVLGVWTVKPPVGTYGSEASRIIREHGHWLERVPSIIAGDLNLDPGREDLSGGGYRRLRDELQELKYFGASHLLDGEAFDAGRHPTYFHNWQQDAGFQLDHCFIHESLLSGVRAVQVGTFDEWVAPQGGSPGYSDHVPTIIDLDLPLAHQSTRVD